MGAQGGAVAYHDQFFSGPCHGYIRSADVGQKAYFSQVLLRTKLMAMASRSCP